MQRCAGDILGGKYRLERPLASGGMSTVWVARHLELDLELAIKFRSETTRVDPYGEVRFRREAQLAAQLRSPHVVHVYDFAVDTDQPYLVMELLNGEDLKCRLDRVGRLSSAEVAEVVTQVASGLTAAHELGIVHRDLKPGNLFLARVGRAEVLTILDFGIAKHHELPLTEETESGVVLGSPAYMSPEQTRGEPLNRYADLWALGVVSFRALTGTHPFRGNSYGDTVQRICSGRFPRPSQLGPGVFDEFDGFYLKAFARDPAQRFKTADEFARAFAKLAGRTSLWPSAPPPAAELAHAAEPSDADCTSVRWRSSATRPLPATAPPKASAGADSEPMSLSDVATRMAERSGYRAAELRILHAADGLVMAELGKVCIGIWRSQATLRRVKIQKSCLEAFVRRTGGQPGFFLVVEATSGPPEAEARRESASMVTSLGSALACAACVIEGTGFRAAITRTVLTGIRHAIRAPTPVEYFVTATAGATWMAKRVPLGPLHRFLAQVEATRCYLDEA